MGRSLTISLFLVHLLCLSLLTATSAVAGSAEPVLGTWTGFDNNSFSGQLRSVELALELDNDAQAPSDQGMALSGQSETIYLKGRMTTTFLQGRANNLAFADQDFDVRAGYLPSLNVLILYPYRERGPGASEQQLAVLSVDGNTLAFIKTARASGWPLPWLLSRRNQSEPVLDELAAIKQAGSFGGAGINTLSVTLQNLKPRMSAQQISEQKQSISAFRKRLAKAMLSHDLAAIRALNTEASEQAKAVVQTVMFSGNPGMAPANTAPGNQACPESVLGWFEAIESERQSERFNSFLEVFNAFRPDTFSPHFGKDFQDLSEVERTVLFNQMSRYCAGESRVSRSRFYQSFQHAFLGGLASSGNSSGPFTAASGARALEIYEGWQQQAVSGVRTAGSAAQAEHLAKVLNAFSGSFWEAKAADIRATADQLVNMASDANKELAPPVAVASVLPAPEVPGPVGRPVPKQKPLPQSAHAEHKEPGAGQQPASTETPKSREASGVGAITTLRELRGGVIAQADALCVLSGGCKDTCRASPDSCPGGEQAALARGFWSNCSDNGWEGEACEVIISRFGKLSQSEPVVVPGAYQSLYALLESGQAFPPTEENLAFVAGLGGYLANECQILGPAETSVVNNFARAGKTFAVMGNNYMNPGRNLGKATSATGHVIAGIELAQNIACRLPESYVLATRIVESIQASDGAGNNGPSRFVATCTRTFSEQQCQCLADIGRATIPDIHTRDYHRNLIREIIERNPMLGFGIGLQCRITNY